MSNFPYDNTQVTVELREIVESGVKIWDFDYPSFYEGDEKAKFEQKVIDHFYFRQIGQETVGRWLHYFRSRVREIMPRYIDMYNTVEIMRNVDDPFGNIDITETYESTNRGSSSSSSTSSGVSKFADTPQGNINNLDNYLTNANINNGDDESTSTSEATQSHTITRKGNQGVNTYAHDIIEFRQSIIDVDMMIIDDLNDLFLKVY